MSGSFGRRTYSSSSDLGDLGRYTEAEDEDYDDMFVKPNGSGGWFYRNRAGCIYLSHSSSGAAGNAPAYDASI